MTKTEFRAKCYEILEENGHLEKDGVLYYPENSIMDLIEFLREAKVTFEAKQYEEEKHSLEDLLKKILS